MIRDAAYFRAHREEFLLALELGITPKAARERLDAIAARERHRAAADRWAEKMNAPLRGRSGHLIIDDPEARDPEPWMMRD